MALYLAMVRYTDKGAAGVLQDGFESRVDAAKTALESVGANLVDYWFVADGDWHAAALIEGPADMAAVQARAAIQQMATGTVSVQRTMRLVTAAEAATTSALDYRAAGE